MHGIYFYFNRRVGGFSAGHVHLISTRKQLILVVGVRFYLNQKAGCFRGERIFLFESEDRLL